MKIILYKIKHGLALNRRLFSYRPTIDRKGVDYDRYWSDKRGVGMGALSDWQKARAEIILSQLRSEGASHPTVLDIGGGEGNIVAYIRDRYPLGECHNADNAQMALSASEERGIVPHYADIGNIDSLKELPETDYALMLEILEHVPNSEEVLETIYSKVKKGVFFSFPNTGYIAYRLRLLFGRFPMQWRLHPGEHLRFWTYSDLKWWLKELGYANVVIRTYKGVPLLRKWFPGLFAMGFVVFIKK